MSGGSRRRSASHRADGPATSSLRIIGGAWRGRRLEFPALPGLRPTPDRVRETLFNWLAPWMPGLRCLDLCAGSGALGLEAASRGASEVVLVEAAPPAARALTTNLRRLQAGGQVRVLLDDARHALSGLQASGWQPQLVLLDPPFADTDLARELLQQLLAGADLPEWLYLEQPLNGGVAEADWAEGWALYRARRAGQVCYRLLRSRDLAAPPAVGAAR